MKGKEINPMLVVPVVVVVVVIFAYFFWLKPKMEADSALRDFNTPEAQAKRDPDQRKVNPTTKALVDELRAKEKHIGGNTQSHRDRN